MTPYPLISPKVYPLVAHIKTKFLAFILSNIHPKIPVSDVINVYKGNYTSQICEILEYRIFSTSKQICSPT